MMRVVVIRHHDIDSAGFIGDAFEARGAALAVHLFPDEGPLPALDGVDHVIVIGAVSSVNDPDPWIAEELAWLRAADQAGVPVLGICFGAQALCAALGGRVEAMDGQGDRLVHGRLGRRGRGPGRPLAGVPRRPLPAARRRRRCWPATTRPCRPSGSAVTWPSSSTPRSTGRSSSAGWTRTRTPRPEQLGIDPDQFLADTIREEPASRARADRLVATALAIQDS